MKYNINFKEAADIISRIIIIVNMGISLYIILERKKEPRIVWAWMMLLNFVPPVGLFVYIIFGMNGHKEKMFRLKEIEKEIRRMALRQETVINRGNLGLEKEIEDRFGELILYNLEVADAVVTNNNHLQIFIDGHDKFDRLKEDIKNAKLYIHLQYYIIQNDKLWWEIESLLYEQVKKGVKIRVLYDGMGTRKIPPKRINKMKENGIEIAVFFPPLFGKLHVRVNYRNHRKIVVIDGTIGYVGGFNIGKEYLGEDKKFGKWRDTHLRIEGAATISLALRFALDWSYTTRTNLFQEDKAFMMGEIKQVACVPIQIISSGPESKYPKVRDAYLGMINKARKNIYIQTPYFVPDESIINALKIAALSGVDVRLMIPCKPDHPIVYWASYSYVGELLEAGVKCYIYLNGFLHAKTLMVDSLVSCCGTANMDIRSFKLNFEINAIIFDSKTSIEMENHFLEDMNKSEELDLKTYNQRSRRIKIKESLCRLFAPVL